MYTLKIDNLDLAQIAESGQCFRWKKISEDHYNIVAFDRSLDIRQRGNEFEFSCDEDEWHSIWEKYLDMDTDYADISRRIDESGDAHLKEAFEKGSGIRILRQDLWEMIVTFMISQNNNISRITKSVDLLCRRCGHLIPGTEDAYSFPKPGEVAEEVFEDRSMGFGYRAAYLKEIYAYAGENPDWLEKLAQLEYDDAMALLLERKGIGKKVANCICLFGLHHVDAFPVDTHVRQLLDEYYKDGLDFDRYKGVAGIIQQYLFYFELKKGK